MTGFKDSASEDLPAANSSNTSNSQGKQYENNKHLSPYQRLLTSLQFDAKMQWELAFGKRVGFYTLRGELGCGNFSRVKAGVHALTKEKVAIKILDKKKMDKKTKRLLCREISSMEKLHHPNIVRLYEVIHTDTKLHLVMEYASGGELFTKLSTQGMMNENDAKIVFAQILSAVQHMHQHNIMHRDLKAENVFYSDKKFVKVGDFGFSTEAKNAKQALNTFCGSPPYAAPELFRDSFYYGESVDIWALGVILYFVVTGTMPFRAETVGKLKKRILSGEFSIPSHVSTNCKELIRAILKPNPLQRHSTAEIRSSDWLGDVSYPKSMGLYRLEPTKIDPKRCRPEEAYALYQLGKLGIGAEELKNYHFPSGDLQSPFSWDSKSESSSNTQVVMRKSLFGGSRSSQSNLQDRVEINESSAMVGTYRILLLRAHKRLSGPSGSGELRRLQSVTTLKRDSVSNDSCDSVHGRCSMCEVDSGHCSPAISSPSTYLKPETQNNATSAASSVCYSSASVSENEDFSTPKTDRTRTEHRKIVRKNKRPPVPVKSKFCTIL